MKKETSHLARAALLLVVLAAVVNSGCVGVAGRSGALPPGGSHSADLQWDASTSSVSGYNVYRGTQSGGPYAKVNSSAVGGTTYTDSTVQGGQTYFYVVTSLDVNGAESIFSNEAQAAVPSP